MVARLVGDQKVVGSTPTCPTENDLENINNFMFKQWLLFVESFEVPDFFRGLEAAYGEWKQLQDKTSMDKLMNVVSAMGKRVAISRGKFGIADDYAQELCIKVYKQLMRDPPDNMTAWLSVVMRNLYISLSKNFDKYAAVGGSEEEYDIADKSASAQSDIQGREEKQELRAMVERLPSDFDYKKIALLFYYQGHSTKEIAAILDIPDAKVRRRLFTIRGLLSKMKVAA